MGVESESHEPIVGQSESGAGRDERLEAVLREGGVVKSTDFDDSNHLKAWVETLMGGTEADEWGGIQQDGADTAFEDLSMKGEMPARDLLRKAIQDWGRTPAQVDRAVDEIVGRFKG